MPTPPFVMSLQGAAEAQARKAGVEVASLDFRLREIDWLARAGMYEQKKEALSVELEDFLRCIPGGGNLRSVTAQNLRRFLAHKDRRGKTQVHDHQCVHLGTHGVRPCGCPKRLAAGTVGSLVGQLRAIFRKMGRGDSWDEALEVGNPACAGSIADYLKVVRAEHSKAHVTPKQAKPLFVGKLERVCDFLKREADCPGVPVQDKFVYLRDRAFLAMQFYAGDRASNISRMLAQEI